jgi:hypothetical protein
MSEPSRPRKPEAALRELLPLLKEYTGKLNRSTTMLHRIRSEIDPASVKPQSRDFRVAERKHEARTDLLKKLLPHARTLAQFASQQASQLQDDDTLRLEVLLRLAEFESAIAIAQKNSATSLVHG